MNSTTIPQAQPAPRPLSRGQRQFSNGALTLLGDLLGLTAAFALLAWLRQHAFDLPVHWQWDAFVLLLWPLGASARRLLPSWGLGMPEEVRLVSGLLLVLFTARAVALTLAQSSSWTDVPFHLSAFLAAWLLVLSARSLTKTLLLRTGNWGLPTVIYADASTSQLMVQALQENQGLGYQPIGVFHDQASPRGQDGHTLPVLGATHDVTPAASLALVAMPGLPREELSELLEHLLRSYHRVIVVPDLFCVQSLWAQTRDLGGVLGLELSRNLTHPTARRVKRALDLTPVLLTSVLWVPLCLLLAGLIWLEDHANPLFKQERVGEGGRVFHTWKFRTMLPNAEAVLQRKLAEDAALRAEWETHFKLRQDPRVTRVGAFLRKTSLDELPQLVNVLRGEMSLVGPRPLPRYHETQLPPSARALRLEARPGMTGLWQVSGRSESGTAGMERWDSYYVRNWSVWLDLVVLLRTVRAVLLRTGAY